MNELVALSNSVVENVFSDPILAREQILAFQEYLTSGVDSGTLPDKMQEVVTKHYHIPGGYAREMTIPENVIVIGKIHLHSCLNIISKGNVIVITEKGIEKLKAPYTFVSERGIKRIAIAVEETIWTTFHVTSETEIEKIEKELVTDTYDDVGLPYKKVELLK